MSVNTADTSRDQLCPVVEDLSAWILPGRVTAATARDGFDDAVAAERLGFRRVYLAERYNLKEAGVVLGGVGALTTRIGLGTGVVAMRARHPLMTAALGASMHAYYGPRFVLGIGRSVGNAFGNERQASYRELLDHVRICKRLWAGETVNYDGPAGTFTDLRLGDLYHGAPPEVWIGGAGLPQGAAAAADAAIDGALLLPMMTPDATYTAVTNMRNACEAAGRDPSSLRICQPVVTAPDLSEHETRSLAHARLVTYLTWPGIGQLMIKLNDWDRGVVEQLARHPQFRSLGAATVDHSFHREELLDPASLIPDEWVEECSAVGSLTSCVAKLQEFKDAGVDELALYGSSPRQNAGLIAAWRERSADTIAEGARHGR
jgi:probable F420-dependent oxidoreductase